jgi:hypothetical protein
VAKTFEKQHFINKTSPKIISPSEAVIEQSWYFYDPQFWQTAV